MVENHIDHALPGEYRDFLLSHNGGRPQADTFIFYGPAPGSVPVAGAIPQWGGAPHLGMVDWFLGIGAPSYRDLIDNIDVYTGRVPNNFMPIAYDPGGNLICISLYGADEGTVYFWDHEEEADDGEVPDYRNIYFIAKSFSEFLNGLTD